MFQRLTVYFSLCFLFFPWALKAMISAPKYPPRWDQLPLNAFQIIGTHNSYKQRPSEDTLESLAMFGEEMAHAIDYHHIPLKKQLERGIRQFELDIFLDPAGGLYRVPQGPRIFEFPEDRWVVLPEAMKHPGMKVFHIQDFDFRSNCLTLVDCLKEVKTFSENNPHHFPITLLLELKDQPLPDPYGLKFTIPVKFTAEHVDRVDGEILKVLPRHKILTPKDVQGEASTLRAQLVTGKGWPKLSELRGKIILLLDNGGELRDWYVGTGPVFKDRLMFASVEAGHPMEAFKKLNDPREEEHFEEIKKAVGLGFMVRTRADWKTEQARANDKSVKDMAFKSGAQYVSTDYPWPEPRFDNNYQVNFGEGVFLREKTQ